MKSCTLAMIALWAAAVPAAARAGAQACWFERGVVVVPAAVAGIAGDYILDTGAPATQLHETRAQGAGVTATALVGDVRIAGQRVTDRTIAVADLDARTWAFPTPIAGVIGADVLSGFVVDVSFAPCRVAIHAAGAAPAFAGRSLPLRILGGLPTVTADASDGASTLSGDFVPATGADAAVRLDGRLAGAPGAERAEDVLPDGPRRATLSSLRVAGAAFRNLPGGLLRAEDAPGAVGVLGPPVLARWRLRFDFPGRRLVLAPAR